MAKVSNLYDFPVTITSEEFEENTMYSLEKDLAGDNGKKVVNFLNTLHSHIYDFLIHNTGRADIKDRIIEQYRSELEKPIKRALILQGKYLLENNNIGLWNGTIATVEGGVDIKDTQDIVQKILCVEAINLLAGTQPNILYAGG
jgi:hypothetical protein